MGYDPGHFSIYSNDGIDLLYDAGSLGNAGTYMVDKTGVIDMFGGPVGDYVYSGNNVFIGLALTPNETNPYYKIGDTFKAGEIGHEVDLYIVEKEKQPVTFDLSTLNLSVGTYEITVKLRAPGYADSEPSNAVSYTVAPQTVGYWGKFTFYQDLGAIEKNQFPPTAVKFTSNNVSYTQISCGEGTIMYDNTVVYNNGWTNEAYRSIDYGGSSSNTQNIDKRFGDWFDAHATVAADEGGCFVAGTPILMADGSVKAIETVKVGEKVLTYNEFTKAYDTGLVLGTIIHRTDTFARVTLADGTVIELTPGHPIYTKRGWATLKENDGLIILGLNDEVLSIDNKYCRVVSIERFTTAQPIEVYNLTIEGEHNYFVGETSILAHNAGSPVGPGGGKYD